MDNGASESQFEPKTNQKIDRNDSENSKNMNSSLSLEKSSKIQNSIAFENTTSPIVNDIVSPLSSSITYASGDPRANNVSSTSSFNGLTIEGCHFNGVV